MSLQEAMATGKKFRAVGTVRWMELVGGDFIWADDRSVPTRELVADSDLPLVKNYEVRDVL